MNPTRPACHLPRTAPGSPRRAWLRSHVLQPLPGCLPHSHSPTHKTGLEASAATAARAGRWTAAERKHFRCQPALFFTETLWTTRKDILNGFFSPLHFVQSWNDRKNVRILANRVFSVRSPVGGAERKGLRPARPAVSAWHPHPAVQGLLLDSARGSSSPLGALPVTLQKWLILITHDL